MSGYRRRKTQCLLPSSRILTVEQISRSLLQGSGPPSRSTSRQGNYDPIVFNLRLQDPQWSIQTISVAASHKVAVPILPRHRDGKTTRLTMESSDQINRCLSQGSGLFSSERCLRSLHTPDLFFFNQLSFIIFHQQTLQHLPSSGILHHLRPHNLMTRSSIIPEDAAKFQRTLLKSFPRHNQHQGTK